MSTQKRRLLLANAVKEVRKARGMTQAQLAERAGVHTQTIGNLERGRHETSVEHLRAVGRVLGVDLSVSAIATRQLIDQALVAAVDRLADLTESERILFAGALWQLVTTWEPPRAARNSGPA